MCLGTRNVSQDELYLDWRSNLIFLPPHVLEFSSIIHVAVLVFSRLMAVRELSLNGKRRAKLYLFSVITIWMVSVTFNIIPLIALFMKWKTFYTNVRLLNLHCLSTFPVICIVVMYTLLVHTVKKNQMRESMVTSTVAVTSIMKANQQRMVVIVRGLVIMLLVCYLPHLTTHYYFYGIILKRPLHQLIRWAFFTFFTLHSRFYIEVLYGFI